MHEFVIILRHGQRFTITADRVVLQDARYIALVTDDPAGTDPDPLRNAIALFERGEVAAIASRGHLLSEEKGEPIAPQFVIGGDSDIPF